MRLSRRAGRSAVRLVGLGLVTLVTLTAADCRPEVVSGEATLTTGGGTVDVQCIGQYKAKIVGTNPAPGYTARIIVAGPSGQASMIFSSPTANDFKIAVHCENLTPQLIQWEIEDTTVT